MWWRGGSRAWDRGRPNRLRSDEAGGARTAPAGATIAGAMSRRGAHHRGDEGGLHRLVRRWAVGDGTQHKRRHGCPGLRYRCRISGRQIGAERGHGVPRANTRGRTAQRPPPRPAATRLRHNDRRGAGLRGRPGVSSSLSSSSGWLLLSIAPQELSRLRCPPRAARSICRHSDILGVPVMGMARHRALPVRDAEHAKRVAGVHVPRVSQGAAREELADVTVSRGEGRGAGVQKAQG